jgi:hypothetical protein
MSERYLIAYGGTMAADADPEAQKAFYQSLLDDLNATAAEFGWPGSDFSFYGVADHRVMMETVPGEAPLTLDRLKQFRNQQRAQRNDERKVA